MSKRKTHEQFVQELYNSNSTIEVLGKYKNALTKVSVKCLSCGNVWDCKPNSLLSGHGCPECGKRRIGNALKKSHQDFINELHRINPNVTVIDQYQGNKEKLKIHCNICGNEWKTTPHDLLSGHGCPICGYEKQKAIQRKTNEGFIEQLASINANIEAIDRYVNNHTKIRFRCKKCGNEWKTVPNSVLLGHGCSKCARSSTSFLEQVIFGAFRQVLGDGVVISRDKELIGMELDIVIPPLQIAYEPGSWAWHYNKTKRDSEKRNLCEKKGYKLITIYTDFKEDTIPFPTDCFVFPMNLGNANWCETKSFVEKLIAEHGLILRDDQWETIRNAAIENSRRIANAEYIKALHKANPTIEVLNEYKDYATKAYYKCLVCGNKWYALPGSVLSGHGCPACGKRRTAEAKRKTNEQFAEEIQKINSKVRLIGNYINNKTKILCECVDCNYKWEMVPLNLLKGQGCPKCGRKRAAQKNRKTHDEFMDELSSRNLPILLKGKYIDSSTKIKAECQKCKYIWLADPLSLLAGHGCPRCGGSIKKTNAQFVYELKQQFPNIEPLEEYQSANIKMQVRCQTCGYTWMIRPHDLLRSKGCPNCRKIKKCLHNAKSNSEE